MSAQSGVPVAAGGRPLRILAVDDNPEIRGLCTSVLERQGFEVLIAEDGRDGLVRAVCDGPDLVLCDISMPVLDGFGLAAALRQLEETQRPPLVFMTAETEPSVRERAYDVGARGFLAKPFEPHTLSSFVQSVLARLGPAAPATEALEPPA